MKKETNVNQNEKHIIKQTVGAVMKTKDYDVFSFIDGNRRLNPRNYSKLLSSMKEEQLHIPIIVNENYEIVDGQHRFTAAKELGLYVYYVIEKGYGLEQVKRANMVSSNWKKEDFLESHIKDGVDGYKDFKDLVDLYGIGISDLIKIFAYVQGKNTDIAGKLFENGTFNFDKKDEVIAFLDALDDFSFFPQYKTKTFVTAFMKLYFNEKYDHTVMKGRLKNRKNKLTKQSSYGEYLSVLTQQIYSYGSTKNLLLYDNVAKRFYS